MIFPIFISCDSRVNIKENEILGTYKFGVYGEESSVLGECGKDAFTLKPNGELIFHDIRLLPLFGELLTPLPCLEDKFKEFEALSIDCSLKDISGKWVLLSHPVTKHKYINFYIDVSSVGNTKLKQFLNKYAIDGWYHIEGSFDGLYHIDGSFNLFYGSKYLVWDDKSRIRILISNDDPDSMLMEYFVKE